MRKIYILFTVMMLAFSMNAQYIYNDYDANQNVPFLGWPNMPVTVANPDATGVNTSANVAMWDREGADWAQYTNVYTDVLPGTIDFTTGTTFSLKVWSPIACEVLFKLEGNAAPVQIFQSITTPNTWVQLDFDFTGTATDTYNKIIFFLDFATFNANTFYFDDIEGPELNNDPPPAGTLTLPVTFDDPDADYSLVDFGGNVSQIIVDPDNADNNIVETIKTGTAELWAGTTVGGPLGFAEPIPFTVDSTLMGVVVWSPEVGTPIRLKVEDANNAGITCETETLTTVAMAWDTLIFNFGKPVPGTPALNVANTYTLASIFFNFGTTGAAAGEQTYYWDYLYFAGAKPYLEENVQDNFENDGWGTIDEWIFQDPQMVELPTTTDPVDGSNTVADYNRSGGFDYANAQFDLDFRMDLTERNIFELDVYFPSSNDYSGGLTTTAALKLQNSLLGGNAWTTQTEILLTVDEFDTWVTLTFDFSAVSDREDYDQVVVQLGGEGHGAPGQFYFDNLYLKHVPYITLLSPNGGEVIEQGEEFEITWDYDYWDGPIQIDLVSGDDELTLVYNIPASDNSYTWTVLDNQQAGDNYKIVILGIEAGDPIDESDDYFSIIDAYVLPQIVISEIMYNPPESGNDSLEFLEFYNKGDEAVDLAGFAMSQGVEYIFPNIVIEPDTFLLLSIDSLAFFATFGIEAYQWTNGALSNGGETVELSDQLGNVVNAVTYSDQLPWDTLADGYGPSLELLNSELDNTLAESWMHSVNFMAVNGANDSIWASPGFGFEQLSAAFEANNTLVLVGDSVMFTDLSTGSPTSWMWTFEGGTPGTYEGETPPYITYNQSGKWDVTLVVSDGDDTDTQIYEEYIWSGMMPVSDFEAEETQVVVGSYTNFMSMATGDSLTYQWAFEGGTPGTSSDENPMEIYYNSSDLTAYDVTLIVSNLFGSDTLTKEDYIEVLPVGVSENVFDEKSISLYPNPTSGNIILTIPESIIAEYKLLDINGRIIQSGNVSRTSNINLSEVNKGMYFLHLVDKSSNSVVTKKLIVR